MSIQIAEEDRHSADATLRERDDCIGYPAEKVRYVRPNGSGLQNASLEPSEAHPGLVRFQQLRGAAWRSTIGALRGRVCIASLVACIEAGSMHVCGNGPFRLSGEQGEGIDRFTAQKRL